MSWCVILILQISFCPLLMTLHYMIFACIFALLNYRASLSGFEGLLSLCTSFSLFLPLLCRLLRLTGDVADTTCKGFSVAQKIAKAFTVSSMMMTRSSVALGTIPSRYVCFLNSAHVEQSECLIDCHPLAFLFNLSDSRPPWRCVEWTCWQVLMYKIIKSCIYLLHNLIY